MPDKFSVQKQFMKDLEVLIKAGFPLIGIFTFEEARAIYLVDQMAQQLNKTLFYWSVTMGLTDKMGKPKDEIARNPQQIFLGKVPIANYVVHTLHYITSSSDIQKNSIVLLRDLHPYLNDPMVIRKLRDLNKILPGQQKHIILLSPQIQIPEDLTRDVTTIGLNLPDYDELKQCVTDFAREQGIEITDSLLIEDYAKNGLGLTLDAFENALAKVYIQQRVFDLQGSELILSEKENTFRDEDIIELVKNDIDFSSVGGLANLTQWLTKRKNAYSDEARAYGLHYPTGVLLFGMPGCGKSLSAKAVANEWKIPLLRLSLGNILEGIVGGSETRMYQALNIAESISPSILWIDEIDKEFASLGRASDSGVTDRLFGILLTWLEERDKPVFLVATCNYLDRLPQEFLRRFDEIFFVELPSVETREEIFAIHLRERQRDPDDFDLQALAELSEDFNGSEIKKAIEEAMYNAFSRGEELSQQDLVEVISNLIPLAISSDLKEKYKTIRTRFQLASGTVKGRKEIVEQAEDGFQISWERKPRKL